MKWLKWFFCLPKLSTPKEEVSLCCGNCEEFDPSGYPAGKGYCPAIYWRYDLLNLRDHWFCRNFQLAQRFRAQYRVDKKKRDPEDGIISVLLRKGVRRRSGLNTSDSVMITSTSRR